MPAQADLKSARPVDRAPFFPLLQSLLCIPFPATFLPHSTSLYMSSFPISLSCLSAELRTKTTCSNVTKPESSIHGWKRFASSRYRHFQPFVLTFPLVSAGYFSSLYSSVAPPSTVTNFVCYPECCSTLPVSEAILVQRPCWYTGGGVKPAGFQALHR